MKCTGKLLVVLAALGSYSATIGAQTLVAPKPKPTAIVRVHTAVLITGVHASAAIFDGWTTRSVVQRGFVEADPLTRPLIGVRPTYGSMAPWGTLEVAGAALLARKWPKMRYLQLGLAGVHFGASIHNLSLPRRPR